MMPPFDGNAFLKQNEKTIDFLLVNLVKDVCVLKTRLLTQYCALIIAQ